MKKCTLVTLVMAFSIAVLSSWCLAQTVTDTSKEGSLLIWPKILTTGDYDTYVAIYNSNSSSVDVKCYWEYKDFEKYPGIPVPRNGCVNFDFQFRMTGNQPAVFSAKTGEHLWGAYVEKSPPIAAFGEGEGLLKCWAVNAAATEQISWNSLKGEAMVADLVANTIWEYNAYRFAANQPRKAAVGQAGRLTLNGSTSGANPGYDACPSYLVFDFLAESDNVTSDLTLIPCIQNLKQEGSPTMTKATFTIWNQNEVKFTGAHQCFSCYIEASLDSFTIPQDTPTSKIKPFNIKRLHTNAARMRVQGLQSNNYCWGSIETPLLGLMSSQFKIFDGDAYPDRAGTNASTAGKYIKAPVYIQWDPGYESEEKVKR
jgi:hypothetical protein